MGADEFKTITNIGEGTYSEKRSKFLAFSHHVESVDEVKDILQSYRKNIMMLGTSVTLMFLDQSAMSFGLMMTGSRAAQQVSLYLDK